MALISTSLTCAGRKIWQLRPVSYDCVNNGERARVTGELATHPRSAHIASFLIYFGSTVAFKSRQPQPQPPPSSLYLAADSPVLPFLYPFNLHRVSDSNSTQASTGVRIPDRKTPNLNQIADFFHFDVNDNQELMWLLGSRAFGASLAFAVSQLGIRRLLRKSKKKKKKPPPSQPPSPLQCEETKMGVFIDPKDLPQDGSGLIQVLFLGAVYGFVLFNASNMISDGSELLLLVPAMAGIVGSVVLPVLGAVPDGAIVLFSGMGPDAQEQMSVGVGALAGSTIMLLTIPWALSVYAGRVNLDAQGRGNYVRPKGTGKTWSKLSPPGNANLFNTGVVLFDEIPTNAKTMIVTSLIYLILQIPALQFTGTSARDSQIDHDKVAASQKPFAFVAFLVCMLAFIAYLYWNVKRSSQVADDTIDEIRVQAIRNGDISLSGVLAQEVAKIRKASPDVNTSLTSRSQIKHVQDIIRPFFHVYDQNRDRRMDADELQVFFRDLGEVVSREEAEKWIQEADKDKSGFIEFDELVEATLKYLIAKYELESQGRKIEMTRIHVDSQRHIDMHPDEEDEEEEDEVVPEDLAHLSIAEQQRKIKLRAAYMMFIGTALVLIFSDPMVDVLSEVGARTGIPAFYVSFVVAPLASNASELIASYNYALKKTSKTISISVSALLGAACMNNTFCLGIFAALMYFKAGGLVWEFSAETLAILLVELIIGVIALKKTQRLFDALIVFLLYPASIALVYLLENVAGLD